MLDLQHGPLARRVRRVGGFADDAVEPGTFEEVEPFACHRWVVGDRGEVHAWRQGEGFEEDPALTEGLLTDILTAEAQYVEGDELGGCRLGQGRDLPAPGLGTGSDAVAEQIELQALVTDDDELPVERRAEWQALGGRHHLGEQVGEVLLLAALQDDTRRRGRRCSGIRPTWVRTAGRGYPGPGRRRPWRASARSLDAPEREDAFRVAVGVLRDGACGHRCCE